MHDSNQTSDSKLLFSKHHLLHLLWPLVVEQLLSVLVGMVDVLMVAYVGEATVSGVSLVDSVNMLVIQVLFALTAGGTVVCAQFIGAGNYNSASKSGGQLLFITTSVMLCISAAFLLKGDYLLSVIFGQVESKVMEDAVKYLLFTSASFPFLAIYYSVAAIFRAAGNTKLAMMASLGMNLLNIIGNAICIFGLHMGVVGVALPTLLARIVAALFMVYSLQRFGKEIRLHTRLQLKPDGEIIRKILAIGIPNSVESGLFNFGKILLQSLVSTLGTASIAAYAVASNLATYLYLPGNALGAGMITIVGQCYGAKKPEQARYYARILLYLNYAFLAVICAVLIIGRSFWVSCYNLSPHSAELAEGLILAHSTAMIIWPVAFLLPYYFRAVGKAAFTMKVAVFAMAVFRVGLAYLFIDLWHKNVLWIWYAMFVDWIFRIIVYGYNFLKNDTFTEEK
jgi:putative MATE family efflux protein